MRTQISLAVGLLLTVSFAPGCPGCGSLLGASGDDAGGGEVGDEDLDGGEGSDAGPSVCVPHESLVDGEAPLVKVLVLLDGSGSLQFTDPANARRAALADALLEWVDVNDVFVATLVFGANVYAYPRPQDGAAFIPVSEWVEPPFLGVAEVQTDLESGLAVARMQLLADLTASDPSDVARTRYIVVAFLDGSPSPVCCVEDDEVEGMVEPVFGCTKEDFPEPIAGASFCEGLREQELCDQEDWLDSFRDANVAGPDLLLDYGDGFLPPLPALDDVGGDINRSGTLQARMSEILALEDEWEAAEVRLSVLGLFDDELDEDIQEIYRLNRCRFDGLMSTFETAGAATTVAEGPDEIDFSAAYAACP